MIIIYNRKYFNFKFFPSDKTVNVRKSQKKPEEIFGLLYQGNNGPQ